MMGDALDFTPAKISSEAVTGLAQIAEHLRNSAEHVETARALLLDLLEASHLSVAVDLVPVEVDAQPAAPAVIDRPDG